jgi:salicylate hydroxylase
LAQVLQLARSNHSSKLQSIAEALEIFDQIRSPYYLKMYNHLDEMKRFMEEAKKAPKASFEDALRVRVSSFGGDEKLSWIYGNDIEKVWEEYVSGKGPKENGQNSH